MTHLVVAASWLTATAAVLIGVAVVLVTRRLTVGLPVLLEMLMAAGLLRLSADQAWSAIGVAAALVLLRKLAVAGIGFGVSARLAGRRETAGSG